ncbi:MAG: DNA polymerase III subunit gamma/tau, partial [Pseudomonadota bacterium]
MEYRVLARKYRPQNFDDLVGQDVLVRTLSNAFATGRIAHAFLLTGIRGIGKTTTARIIARALNCIGTDGQGAMSINPCGVCSNCIMIAESRHFDVLEMDAASNTGVDNMRDIINNVQYLPVSARYKVYIIDEVHMLSNNAFNALLKTLEEPPPHVKFILATTEIRKIPVTILSRCQKFELKRIESQELAKHLANVLTKENLKCEEEALSLIANAAEGSVRDSLSLLDQAIAQNSDSDGIVKATQVREMLGINDKSQLFKLLSGLFSGSIAEVIAEFRHLHACGADPIILIQDLLEFIHFITRLKITPQAFGDISFSEEERGFAKEIADKTQITVTTKFWQMLLKGLQEAKIAPDPATSVEMTFIRIAHSSDLPSPADLIRKIQNNESVKPSNSDTQKPQAMSLIPTSQALPLANNQAATATIALANFEQVAELFKQKREVI